MDTIRCRFNHFNLLCTRTHLPLDSLRLTFPNSLDHDAHLSRGGRHSYWFYAFGHRTRMNVQDSMSKNLPDVREGERVVMVIRHHWFVLLRQVFGLAILFILPFILIPFFVTAFLSQSGLAMPAGVGIFFSGLWSLMMWHILFSRWTDYYFDIWVITNLRIVDIDQQGLFRRDVTTLLDLEHIQDVNTKLNGIIGNILTFGNVELQTAGSKREFQIDEVPNPFFVEKTIRETRLEHAHRTVGGPPPNH